MAVESAPQPVLLMPYLCTSGRSLSVTKGRTSCQGCRPFIMQSAGSGQHDRSYKGSGGRFSASGKGWQAVNSRVMVRVSLLAALTGLLSWIRIPLPSSPVPITGQTLGVMLSGFCLGPSGGALSQAVYVLVGSLGVPVFAGGAGWTVLLGPTGGFIWGFIPGAWVVGYLISRKARISLLASLSAFTVGGAIIPYLTGAAFMALLTGRSLWEVLWLAVIPFVPGDLLKILAAAMITRRSGLLRYRKPDARTFMGSG